MSLLMRSPVWQVVTAADVKRFVQFKVWVKPGAEQSFLYGNHVLKSGLGRITENTMQYQGVVVYSMADVPLVSSPQACDLWVLLAFSIRLLTCRHRLLSGFWRCSQVHSGMSASGSHVHSRVPPGRRGRVHTKRRFLNIKDASSFFFFLNKLQLWKSSCHFICCRANWQNNTKLDNSTELWLESQQNSTLQIDLKLQ